MLENGPGGFVGSVKQTENAKYGFTGKKDDLWCLQLLFEGLSEKDREKITAKVKEKWGKMSLREKKPYNIMENKA